MLKPSSKAKLESFVCSTSMEGGVLFCSYLLSFLNIALLCHVGLSLSLPAEYWLYVTREHECACEVWLYHGNNGVASLCSSTDTHLACLSSHPDKLNTKAGLALLLFHGWCEHLHVDISACITHIQLVEGNIIVPWNASISNANEISLVHAGCPAVTLTDL